MGRGPVCGMMTRRTEDAGAGKPVLRLRPELRAAASGGGCARRRGSEQRERSAGAGAAVAAGVRRGAGGLCRSGQAQTATAGARRTTWADARTARSSRRRTRDHRADRRLAGDRRRGRRRDDVGLPAAAGDDAARRGRNGGPRRKQRCGRLPLRRDGASHALRAGRGMRGRRRRRRPRQAAAERLWRQPQPACAREWP